MNTPTAVSLFAGIGGFDLAPHPTSETSPMRSDHNGQ